MEIVIYGIMAAGIFLLIVLYLGGYWEVLTTEEVSKEIYEAEYRVRETDRLIETRRVTHIVEKVTYVSGRKRYKTYKYYVPIPNN